MLAVTAGCASSPLAGKPPTIEPARAAQSPPASEQPSGVVWPLAGPATAALFDPGVRQLATLEPGAASLTVFAAPQGTPRVIALPGPGTALAGDGRGKAYVAGRGGYVVVELATGHTTSVSVAGEQQTDFTAIARRADGRLVLGSADGAVCLLASPDRTGTAPVSSRNKIFDRVDYLVAQGNTTVVLDRGQTSVTSIDADGRVRESLRAGEGATTLAADPLGVVLAADTRGGQLLVYGVDPLMLRQAYPVREAPYGLAGSRELAWVSQTGSNMVVGYDLSTGIPVEKVRYPTVQQPNSLAFDEQSGTLYVVSGSGAGVQVIEHAAGTP
ncbi:YncE family protein [Mycobacterium sp. Marseille-P9652]|uniref:YncE family protein n=1 Tax=Mycobacterium sp. Marseille-P9652 TaxID=2654950 RepID=UPI0012E81319